MWWNRNVSDKKASEERDRHENFPCIGYSGTCTSCSWRNSVLLHGDCEYCTWDYLLGAWFLLRGDATTECKLLSSCKSFYENTRTRSCATQGLLFPFVSRSGFDCSTSKGWDIQITEEHSRVMWVLGLSGRWHSSTLCHHQHGRTSGQFLSKWNSRIQGMLLLGWIWVLLVFMEMCLFCLGFVDSVLDGFA